MVRTPSGWSGHNTDVAGCVDAVRAGGVAGVRRGIVVGAGATAASALAAMVQLGAERVDVLARSVERARWLSPLGVDLGVEVRPRSLADLTDPETWPRADLLVSTIPAEAQVEWAVALSGLADVVFDVVYEPRMTPLLGGGGGRPFRPGRAGPGAAAPPGGPTGGADDPRRRGTAGRNAGGARLRIFADHGRPAAARRILKVVTSSPFPLSGGNRAGHRCVLGT